MIIEKYSVKTSETISSESIKSKNWKTTSEIMQNYETNLWSDSKHSGNISTQKQKSITTHTSVEKSSSDALL